jgi:ABC-type polysaccharide/polyol phosphate transport system ATPase subunit
MPPIIEVNHVTKQFTLGEPPSLKRAVLNGFHRLAGKPVQERPLFKALDDVHFAVKPGEVLGIIGHNGAGKSTLLKILAGISDPTGGRVLVRGRVAPLIEVGAGLIPDLTGRENIFLNAAVLGMKRAEVKRRFDEIVDFAELSEFIDTPIKRYSSGMRVRLGFAIATAVASEILIVDEVLAVGDLAFQRKCYDRMDALIRNEGRTVLLVSHDIRQVERLCTRVLMLTRGRVSVDGEPKQACNAFYEESDDKIHKVNATTKVAPKLSSNDVELLNVAILDGHRRPATSIDYLEDIELVVTYEVKTALPELVFGIGIHTTDMLHLATSQSLGQQSLGPVQPGQICVRYRVRRFPFLPGVYSVRLGVAIAANFHPVFYAESVLSIRVTGKDASRSLSTDGFIRLEGEWDCTFSTGTKAPVAARHSGEAFASTPS